MKRLALRAEQSLSHWVDYLIHRRGSSHARTPNYQPIIIRRQPGVHPLLKVSFRFQEQPRRDLVNSSFSSISKTTLRSRLRHQFDCAGVGDRRAIDLISSVE